MTQAQKTIETLNDEFNSLHHQLVCKGEYDLAGNISRVYWRVQASTFREGIEFMKKLHKNK